jgi:hypothetical protein
VQIFKVHERTRSACVNSQALTPYIVSDKENVATPLLDFIEVMGKREVEFVVIGKTVGDAEITLHLGSRDGPLLPGDEAKLRVRVLPKKTVTVAFTKPSNISSPASQRTQADANNALGWLNEVWNRQANIHFVAHPTSFWRVVNVEVDGSCWTVFCTV